MNFNTFNVTVSKQDPKRSRTTVDPESFRVYVILVSGMALTDYFDSSFYVIMAILFGGGLSMLATILAGAWIWLADKREARRARREADRELKEFEEANGMWPSHLVWDENDPPVFKKNDQ